jgi:hypothetical protein
MWTESSFQECMASRNLSKRDSTLAAKQSGIVLKLERENEGDRSLESQISEAVCICGYMVLVFLL